MPHPKKKHPPRPWKQAAAIACALAAIVTIAAIFRDTFAECLGYAATVTETTTAPGDTTATVKEIATSSPGGRFLRDFIIALAVVIGMMIAGVRSYASFTESKTAESRLLNERFAAAAELMAKETANGNPAIAARIGGIYIMEELANSNPARFLRQAVINLIAYIKDNAQLTATPPLKEGRIPDAPRFLGEDVKAAFAVINSLRESHKKGFPAADLDLSHQNFSCLNFNKGQIEGMRFFNWEHTVLQGALLNETDLRGTDLSNADLRGAIFLRTKLNGAELQDADLRLAYLHGASMQGASLLGANLSGAHFPYSDLRGADLWSARIHNACFPSGTRFGETEMPIEECIGEWSESDRHQCLEEMGRLGVKPHPEVRHIGKTVFLRRDMDGKIWGCQGWPHSAHRPDKMPWDFSQYEDGYAIAGILRNFAKKSPGCVKPPEPERAKDLRMQARHALENGKLPQNLPEKWREWLSGVCPDDDSHLVDSLP